MQSFYSKPLRPMRPPDWEAEDAAVMNGVSSGSRASSSSAPPPAAPPQSQPQQPQSWPAVAVPARRFTLQELRSLSFDRWLLGLDASGGMARYRAVLEEHYDTVSQIAKTYVLSDGSFDDQFYDDVGVSIEAHRELFRVSLMSAMRGEDAALASGSLVAATVTPAARASELTGPDRANGIAGHDGTPHADDVAGSQHAAGISSCLSGSCAGGGAGVRQLPSVIAWLEANGLGGYLEALQDAGYDDLLLLPRLRPSELDEMLEAVVAKPGHRAKFRHAVESLRVVCG